MKLVIWLSISAFLLVGCSARLQVKSEATPKLEAGNISPDPDCPPAVRALTLNNLMYKFPQYGELDVWLSKNYDPAYWNPLFNEEQTEIDKWRAFALKQPPCLATAYEYWLEMYERKLNEARSELQFKELKRRQDAFDLKSDDNRKELEKLKREHPEWMQKPDLSRKGDSAK